jgi:hypothetical protein
MAFLAQHKPRFYLIRTYHPIRQAQARPDAPWGSIPELSIMLLPIPWVFFIGNVRPIGQRCVRMLADGSP